MSGHAITFDGAGQVLYVRGKDAEANEARELMHKQQGGYENSPACKMLASHCAVCGRALVDAKSIETGVGPTCRERFGYDNPATEDARKEANAIVYKIALEQTKESILIGTKRLEELGFDVLAHRIRSRIKSKEATVLIIERGDVLLVKTPYSPESVGAMRQMVPGRRWDSTSKMNSVPMGSKRELWNWLKKYFLGVAGEGPKGLFTIGL